MSRDRLLQKLDAVEAEMRRLGYWQENLPMLGSCSHLKAPSFEIWLQQVFLPEARRRVRDRDLPMASRVGVIAMRQYDYHSTIPEAQTLLRLLFDFDHLINEEAR